MGVGCPLEARVSKQKRLRGTAQPPGVLVWGRVGGGSDQKGPLPAWIGAREEEEVIFSTVSAVPRRH